VEGQIGCQMILLFYPQGSFKVYGYLLDAGGWRLWKCEFGGKVHSLKALVFRRIDYFPGSARPNLLEHKARAPSVDAFSNSCLPHLVKRIDAIGYILDGTPQKQEVKIKGLAGQEVGLGGQRWFDYEGMWY
jgi:hypothetical protein